MNTIKHIPEIIFPGFFMRGRAVDILRAGRYNGGENAHRRGWI